MKILGNHWCFDLLNGWSVNYLSADVLAGLTLASVAVPEQMATARLAGLTPEMGFFAFIAGCVAFAVFGASRWLSVGADLAIAPIFAGGLAIIAASGSPAYASLAAALALLVGLILVIAGIFRMGWIANLLSVPVTTGFLAAIAIHIVISQLPALLSVPAGSGSFYARAGSILFNVSHTNPYALLIGFGVFAITFVSEKISPRIPGALLGVAISTLAVVLFRLESRGVSVLGSLERGWPRIGLPAVSIGDLVHLIPLSIIISIVVMVQSAATTRSFVSHADGPPDVDRDFIGVGAGNILSGLVGAFPVNASPPRTAVISESGGHSQIAGLVAAVLVGLLVVLGPKLLAHVPAAGLAGILLFVAFRITRFSLFAQIYRQSDGEIALVVLTLVAIVTLPIQYGVATGVLLSILHGVWTTTRAHTIEFERVPGTSIWWPPSNPARGEKLEGVAVLAFQAPLSFLNAYAFRRDILKAIHVSSRPLQLIIIEASSIVEIDFTASQILADIINKSHEANISFALARLELVRGQVALERFGIIQLLGRDRVFQSVQDAINKLAPDHLATDKHDV